MSLNINDDKKVAEKRKKPLEGIEEPLAEQSPKKLLKKLENENFGRTVEQLWRQGNGDRSAWLTRQEAFLQQYDEFLDPIVDAPMAWASDLHLPVALTIGKTFHARFYSALMGTEPYCNVKARKAANEDRTTLVSDLMHYAMKSWANDYNGIEAEIDTFVWNWAMRGIGVLKMSWDKRYSRILDVVKRPRPVVKIVIGPEGQEVPVETIEFDEVEEEMIIEDCNAPRLRRVAPENLVIIGGGGDIDQADAVLEQVQMTASDLWTLVDQGVFDEDAVKEIIKGGDQPKAIDQNAGITQMQSDKSGAASMDKSFDLDRYQIIEAYVKKDVDGSGINSDIVTWSDLKSGRLLRATYLHRINRKTKKRPYAKADFYIREGQTYGIGLVELTYSICNEIDSLNNMALDFGLLSTLPFGYYRAGSNLTQETISVEPGSLIPVEDPQSIFFPTLGNRATFSMQHLQFLFTIIERLTGISDLNLGVIGAQGATRTASGVRAIMSESNNNLDIFLRRLNRAMRKAFQYTFAMVQEKMPEGFEFRVFGDNGEDYFQVIKSRDEIAGHFDFEFEPNSASSNPSIRMDTASQVVQLTSNPLDIQLGIITPVQRYAALKNYLIAMGVKDYGKFIQKPQNMERTFTPEEMASRILSGVDVPVSPNMDLQGFVAYAQEIMDSDELLGQFNQQQALALAAKQKEAMQMMEALKQMAAQQANSQQMQRNSQQSMEQVPQTVAPASAGGGPIE